MRMGARPLVIIEAPGKVRSLSAVLRGLGIAADVWPTRGHLCEHSGSLWPLGILPDGSEPGRVADELRVNVLRRMALRRTVLIATDADQEGDVIARDISDVVSDVAAQVKRIHLRALDRESVCAAFADLDRVSLDAATAGDARRIIDRLIGHSFSKSGLPVGRVFSALLRCLADSDPVIGHATLTLPAQDGGRPFVVHVPVRASARAVWEQRVTEPLPAAAVGRSQPEPPRRPWDFGRTVLRGALARPALRGDGGC